MGADSGFEKFVCQNERIGKGQLRLGSQMELPLRGE